VCGCNKQPVDGREGYTKAKDGRYIRNDTMTEAAMTLAGFPRKPVDGVVHWAYLDWYGVPYPLRLLLWADDKITHPRKLPGCGCLKILKDLWTSLT